MAEALRAGDRERRQRLLGALGSLRDATLAREALGLILDERLDLRESVWILFGLGAPRETSRLAFDFLKSHYDEITRRLPKGTFSVTAYLPWVASGLYSGGAREEIEAFFRPRTAAVEGGPRVLDQALERTDQCRARKATQGPSLAAFLRSRAGRGRLLPMRPGPLLSHPSMFLYAGDLSPQPPLTPSSGNLHETVRRECPYA